MPRRVVRTTSKNTGLDWFFTAFDPEVLQRPHRKRRERERKAKLANMKPSSTHPRRIARLRKRRRGRKRDRPVKLKQLGEE